MNHAETTTAFVSGEWGEECTRDIILSNDNVKFDLIVMADVLYHIQDFFELAQTIVGSASGAGADIFICYEKRRTDLSMFFEILEQSKELSLVRLHLYSVVGPKDVDSESSVETRFCIHHYRFIS